MNKFPLSEKYKDFMKCQASVEFLEGTTFAGKTTVGIVKFMLKVAESQKKLHIISGLDTGVIEKNILNKDCGLLEVFGSLVEYNAGGKGINSLPHIVYHTQSGEKIIYILGYDNKARWKKALGGQYGCVYIDEINIADMEYVREVSMRCDYFMGTLNPDNPALPVYSEYINHARPIEKYKNDAPIELLRMLNEEPKDNWVWWYFSFKDNASLTEEKRNQIVANVPTGTKIYKNKILGLRGKATGLVFSNFDRKVHTASVEQIKKLLAENGERIDYFSAGLDTAYSQNSPDTIALSFIGITNKRRLLILDEKVYNNSELGTPLAPSDTVINFIDFLDRNKSEWGFARQSFIDNADQATITEFKKYKNANGSIYDFIGAYKKTVIVDRINMQLGWFAKNQILIANHCTNYINELEVYSWREDKDNTPEDGNDHMINSVQYAFLPYKSYIGGVTD